MGPMNDSFEQVQAWIKKNFGMSFSSEQGSVLKQRLEQFCRNRNLNGLAELHQRLVSGGDRRLTLALAETVSTNHTYFYREAATLDYYCKEIIPELPSREKVRIWSAACSSGDEAYTVSMLTAEHLGLEETKRRMTLLGTDISPKMVKDAETAIYPGHRFQRLPGELKGKYCKPLGLNQYRVREDLTALCTFRRLNLAKRPWPFSAKFDVVFLRNVLYYFDREQQIDILNGVLEVTKPGGWLLTSVTETISNLGTGWKSIDSGIHRRPAEEMRKSA